MKKTVITLLALLCAAATQAQAKTKTHEYRLPKPDKVLLLYPQGQAVDKGIEEDGKVITLGPGASNGFTGDEQVAPNGNISNTNDQARMEIYLPKKCNGQMIVCCPGGGYAITSSVNEGSRVADWCLKHDIACCVVIYRMPDHKSIVPLTDVQNAFRYCRHHAAEWGVNQIGIIGFSAGGHLAASASTLFVDEITRPDFSLLIYPVITFEEFVTHNGTRRRLCAENPTRDQVKYYSLENQVSPKTPETLLVLSADDKTVPPENSIRYYQALQRNGVKGELHIFTSGGHGWGFTTTENSGKDQLGDTYRQEFYSLLERWLGQIKK